MSRRILIKTNGLEVNGHPRSSGAKVQCTASEAQGHVDAGDAVFCDLSPVAGTQEAEALAARQGDRSWHLNKDGGRSGSGKRRKGGRRKTT